MKWLLVFAATVVGGLSDADVIFVNDTGLAIARVEIDSRKLEAPPATGASQINKALISVTPARHDLKVVFRGGAEVKWPKFDFRGVHEIYFQRNQNVFEIRVQ